MAKLPRLNRLRWWFDSRADNADGIFNTPAVNRCCHQQPHEIERLGLLERLAVEMA